MSDQAVTALEWDAERYDRLSRPQSTWGEAVLDRLALRGDETVVDVGCGSGRVTEGLVTRLPGGRVVAVDRSPNMLHVAAANLRTRFRDRVWVVRADALALPFAGIADVAFSTAAFHWVLDQRRLFASIFTALKPGGELVAQCGGGPNLARLLGRAANLAAAKGYARFFEGWREPWVFADEATTARRLQETGFVSVRTWAHPAPVTFATAGEFEDFLACVCVRAYVERLPRPERPVFLRRLTERAAEDDPPFTLDYWRLNLSARRPTLCLPPAAFSQALSEEPVPPCAGGVSRS